MRLVNLSCYRTDDLKRVVTRALLVMGAESRKTIVILPSKVGCTRGCAEVGDRVRGGGAKEADKIAIEIAPPSKFSMRKFARILQHEILHTLGVTHAQMTRQEYWSLGGTPKWTRGLKVRLR